MATVLDQFNMPLGVQLTIGVAGTVQRLRFGIWEERRDVGRGMQGMDWKLPLELEQLCQPTAGSPELQLYQSRPPKASHLRAVSRLSSMVETTLNPKPKALRYHVPILCIDPFTGDTNMWANYQTEPRAVNEVGLFRTFRHTVQSVLRES